MISFSLIVLISHWFLISQFSLVIIREFFFTPHLNQQFNHISFKKTYLKVYLILIDEDQRFSQIISFILNYTGQLMADKQKTSVFSQYQNNENDSITSRQLQFWLKQTGPKPQQKPIHQWTLMSTNSIYEQDEHPLFRNQTFQSINKQNDSIAFNSVRTPMQNTSTVIKSKSYLNAMTDLQNKVKSLEQENQSLKQSLKMFRDERSRAVSQSTYMNESLRSRIEILEPKAKKMEEVIKENKKLRDWKDENSKKMKMLEKSFKETQDKYSMYEKEILGLKQNEKQIHKKYSQQCVRVIELEKQMQKFKVENSKLLQKNKLLENMKQKSTTSVLEKYSKSVDEIQHLTHQNDSLKKEIISNKAKSQEKLRQLVEEYRREKQASNNFNERLKQQNHEKKQMISVLNKQLAYFKQKYEKNKQQLIQTIKNYTRQMEQMRQREMQLIIQCKTQSNQYHSLNQIHYQMPKTTPYLEPKQEIDINRESIIQSNHVQQAKNIVESQLQFQELNQLQEEVEELQNPLYQTRSLIQKKKQSRKIKNREKNVAQTLSQENFRPKKEIEQIKIIEKINTINHSNNSKNRSIKQTEKSMKNVQKLSQKSQQKSRKKQTSKSRSRERSRQKSQQIERSNQGVKNQHSFILKSHEPLTHKEQPQFLYYTEEPAHNSASYNRKQIPYYWDSNQVGEFMASQKGVGTPLTSQFQLQKALLNQINREAVRLIQDQERLVLEFSTDHLSLGQRAQYNGRLKQLNEQIKMNHQKRLQIKRKINQY